MIQLLSCEVSEFSIAGADMSRGLCWIAVVTILIEVTTTAQSCLRGSELQGCAGQGTDPARCWHCNEEAAQVSSLELS